MKKTFKFYTLCWAIMLALFNVICFVTPSEIGGVSKFDGSFWVGYGAITLAFLGQLFCARTAFKEENLQKFFYRIPLITLSYSALLAIGVFGAVCMIIPGIPSWIAVIGSAVIFAFSAISILKAALAGELVQDIDEKIKEKTQFTKLATVTAENLLDKAKNEDEKEALNKLFEAIRYSDPMSTDELKVEEAKITLKMDELSKALSENNGELVKALAEEAVLLVNERNRKCKALK